ncbi:MAG: hypothetical protein DRQ55_14515 [Planctomycetota bacterium]|nr:MAG: hypothetical protein DRQ55_14515 [Planctomycetota bacterium]
MLTTTRAALLSLGLHVLAWTVASGLFGLVRYYGLGSIEDFAGYGIQDPPVGWFVSQVALAGVVLGLPFGLISLAFHRPRFRSVSYARLIGLQSTVHVVLIVVVLGVFRAQGFAELGQPFRVDVWFGRTFSSNTVVVLIFSAVTSVIIGFVHQANRKFGPGNLWKIFLGKYHHPRVESRIFMFLDLQSSTTHAERLGHVRYSRLIQDCFRDLAVVLADHAEVYQYVGDEAVLCWETERGLSLGRCLRAFYRFDAELVSREQHYQREYGLVPVFKAGLNVGDVTVAEVGEIKREIAYHGDVLNTAARIQARCNELGKRVLISEDLKDALGDLPAFVFERLGTVALRGRGQTVDIFAVEPSAAGAALSQR